MIQRSLRRHSTNHFTKLHTDSSTALLAGESAAITLIVGPASTNHPSTLMVSLKFSVWDISRMCRTSSGVAHPGIGNSKTPQAVKQSGLKTDFFLRKPNRGKSFSRYVAAKSLFATFTPIWYAKWVRYGKAFWLLNSNRFKWYALRYYLS